MNAHIRRQLPNFPTTCPTHPPPTTHHPQMDLFSQARQEEAAPAAAPATLEEQEEIMGRTLRSAAEAVEVARATAQQAEAQSRQLRRADHLADEGRYVLDLSARTLRNLSWSGWVANRFTRNLRREDYVGPQQSAGPQRSAGILLLLLRRGGGRIPAPALALAFLPGTGTPPTRSGATGATSPCWRRGVRQSQPPTGGGGRRRRPSAKSWRRGRGQRCGRRGEAGEAGEDWRGMGGRTTGSRRTWPRRSGRGPSCLEGRPGAAAAAAAVLLPPPLLAGQHQRQRQRQRQPPPPVDPAAGPPPPASGSRTRTWTPCRPTSSSWRASARRSGPRSPPRPSSSMPSPTSPTPSPSGPRRSAAGPSGARRRRAGSGSGPP